MPYFLKFEDLTGKAAEEMLLHKLEKCEPATVDMTEVELCLQFQWLLDPDRRKVATALGNAATAAQKATASDKAAEVASCEACGWKMKLIILVITMIGKWE